MNKLVSCKMAKCLFIASIVLNLTLIGYIVGAQLSTTSVQQAPRHHAAYIISHISPEQKAQLYERTQKIMTKRSQIAKLIGERTLDEQKLHLLFDEIAILKSQKHGYMQNVFKEMIPKLSYEERLALQEKMHKKIVRMEKRLAKWAPKQ